MVFLGASKCSKKEQNAKCLKYIGVFLFFMSILIGILALFGLPDKTVLFVIQDS